MTDSKRSDAFFKVHHDIPREGPGSNAMTKRALDLLLPLPKNARVLDLGCGPGKSTLVLARELNNPVIAIDPHESFLHVLRSDAEKAGLSDKIETRIGVMMELNESNESIDLIWSEGAVYIVGFDNALKYWLSLLKPGGIVACTELSWTTDNPPEEAKSFWDLNYPAMRSREENIQAANKLGYVAMHALLLPENCWWDEYYGPLAKRIESLADEAKGDSCLADVIEETRQEIALYEKYSDSYGYVFYLLQKPV